MRALGPSLAYLERYPAEWGKRERGARSECVENGRKLLATTTRKHATAQEQHAHAWGLSAQRAIREYFSFKSRLISWRGGQM